MSRDYDQARIIEENEPEEKHLRMAYYKLVNEIADVTFKESKGLIECTFRTIDVIEELQERISNLEDENNQLHNRLDTLGDIGVEKTNKEEKISAIVTYASNTRKSDDKATKVLPKNIQGIANVSRRYAYDLIDDMINGDGENGAVGPDGYSWAHDPAEITQYGSAEMDSPQKGVIIDFEGVHGESVSMNNFTTQDSCKGGAD
jgi:hypothetical protein